MKIEELMKERIVVLDGAMGSQILLNAPSTEDFGTTRAEGCLEVLNETRPQWIQKIHESYCKAGADAIETNTFGCNAVVLSEYGLAHRTYEMNLQACRLARDVVSDFRERKFVIGSVGPGSKLLTLGHVDYSTLFSGYVEQMRGLLDGGSDAILIETSQDLSQMKLAVRAARHAMKSTGILRPLWVQWTMERSGATLLGSDMAAVLCSLEALGVDLVGLNCATGPDEMRSHIAFLSQNAPMAISCLPNAGLPVNDGGKMIYPQSPRVFAEKVAQLAADFGLNVVGGCCGTTPEHIAELAKLLNALPVPKRNVHEERNVASLYHAISLNQEPKPLFVGERTNANGSKKFRDLLAKEDFDGLVSIAKEQQKEGAHVLDVCVACVGRDEVQDMERFVRRLVTQVDLPLMIDSTEVPVIECALQIAPGKCIVNSINFEDGGEKARKILSLCKEYGAAVVALTIDEQGMAKTAENKLAITQRLFDLVVGEFGLNPGDLCIDPLTFTLGSGTEEFRDSAIETLKGIKAIREAFPEVHINLGLSNVSFGLSPYVRQVINSVMLSEALKCGLDVAILNSSKIIPLARIPEEERQLASDLVFDRRSDGYDPLKKILEKFSSHVAQVAVQKGARAALAVEERLQLAVLEGDKRAVVADVDDALQRYAPLEIINRFLLEGMRIVGERFGAGEMQLPFVLESAEVMKSAVAHLKPRMPKSDGLEKGCLVIATVRGDVHDIGKNLVDIILTNNGYKVINLGIKQAIEEILPHLKEGRVDALGLSGLLVKSTLIMKENLKFLAENGIKLPVILGGAALTRNFVELDCQSVYEGPVFFAADAFAGLSIMDEIVAARRDSRSLDREQVRARLNGVLRPVGSQNDSALDSEVTVIRRGTSSTELNEYGQSSWVQPQLEIPIVPFWGTRKLELPMEEVFDYLDEFALVRGRWGFVKGAVAAEEFEQILTERALPVLRRWRQEILSSKILCPLARYGYFPVCSQGNELLVYAPDTKAVSKAVEREVVARFDFPRQRGGRRLSIADFILPVDSGRLDVLGVQIVTMGKEATQFAEKLHQSDRFSDYFYFHGLTTELAEACAELVHRRCDRHGRKRMGASPISALEGGNE